MGSMPRDNNNGATTTSHETNVGTGNNSQISFLSRVQQLLVHPDDPHVSTVTSEDLRAVAQELCSEIVQLEDRKHLLKHLEKPGLSALRQKLATRVLSGREFLKLGRDELMTEEEKQLEEQRITKIIEEQEKVSLANVAVTSLFKCPACGENRCSFYEQQIRSADEPTTKFLRCLECNNAWTTE
uniref:WGS project CAEQ00000000 data, annotated contig 1829 n=1 Tax=Trypanosoma congolense (strain IL3000) TaxID=1068625 RepID=F9W973_TRYCI|nr:unnamed protein product [Trypanosoma congolense IL3000]